MASICGQFPIYSQTFVYQELSQLQCHGFEVRHAYSLSLPREDLHGAFSSLWPQRCRLPMDWGRNQRDFEYYRERSPERVAELLDLLAKETGKSEEELVWHYDLVRAFSYTRMVEAWQPDWLQSYFFYERSFYSLVAGWMLGIPRGVSSYADHLLTDYDFKLVPLQLRLCDVVVATSARIKDELLGLAPDVDESKIVVKPNAIDSHHFPVVERVAPAAGAPFRIACVARLEPKKGLTYLLEAMRLLRDRGARSVELHLVGDVDHGNEASVQCGRELREFVAENQLEGCVHLEGRKSQEEVRSYLEASHLWVAPFIETDEGDKDGIPTALLEAMATGSAVIVSDAGSMLEVVHDGVNGVVVSQRSGAALADAIEGLLGDPDRCRRLGSAAVRTIAESFDVTVCESRLHRAIDAVLQRRSSGDG